MKHYFCGRRAVLEWDVQPLERKELDPYRLKMPLLHRHIVDVSELMMPTGSCGKQSAYNGRSYRLQILVT